MATFTGTTGNDTLIGTNADDSISGLDGSDYISARAGNDTVVAGNGNDWIDMNMGGASSYGNDVIDGGAGFDTLEFGGYVANPIVVDWAAGTITGGGVTVSFANIERVFGSNFADQMTGDANANNLTAASGDDTLRGAGGGDTLWGEVGNDRLEGGAGNDWMNGGAGNDTFAFREFGSTNSDTIDDFATSVDKIALDAAAFTTIGSSGNFVAGDARFYAAPGASAAQDSDDRIVYNTTTGQLYYDADGVNGAAPQLIATLRPGTALTAADITVEGTSGATIVGTSGDDALTGTDGNDSIDGAG